MPNTEPEARLVETKVIHVAVAVIENDDGRILIAQRPVDKHMGGKWEFPGGKVEAGESLPQAMKRELQEELGVETETVSPVIQIRHEYPEKTVLLDVWRVRITHGQPHGAEGQPVVWAALSDLKAEDFPPANRPIITALKLPESYMITGRFQDETELREHLERSLKAGVGLVCFRAGWLAPEEYQRLATTVVYPLCQQYSARLLLKGGIPEKVAAGIHFTSIELESLTDVELSGLRSEGELLAASCHDFQQLEKAAALGIDFVTLSPVSPTRTHPDAPPLGRDRAAELTAKATVPVYWLGGMEQADRETVISAGAQGIAAISAFWKAKDH